MKAWNLVLTILIISTTSGCAMSKQVVKGEHDTITDTYLSAVSEGRADSAGYIRDNLKIDKAFGARSKAGGCPACMDPYA